ncbi:MAG: type II secretion system F family protein [Planctomycetes bacterium]|nr:type II secretion system F family protein [Planctomycetota bacterium]
MTLEQFIALNEEIAALVRSGVPLDQGLAALGDDMPGRLGKAATAVAEQTARGEPLDKAILDQTVDLPPAYRAVVHAGLRAGRLPAALEAVAGSARRLTDTYRAAVVAVAYPLMIFALVWLAAVVLTTVLAPRLASGFHSMDLPGDRFFAVLGEIGRWAWYWGPVAPAAVVLLVAAWWSACRRAAMLHAGWSARVLGGMPWIGRMLRLSRAATFLEILALLIENETPLDEAVSLAADASGDPQTQLAARRLAEAEKGTGSFCLKGPKGASHKRCLSPFPGLPPLMRWIMFSARREGALLPALQRGAAAYHRRARHQADLVRTLMPVVLTVVFAGSVTAAYVLTIFAPYVAMLHALGDVAGK